MEPQKKTSAKIAYFSLAYATFIGYLLIVLTLIFTINSSFGYELILIVFLLPSAFSLFFSTNIIRKSLLDDLDFNKTIIKLAIAHLPTLMGLVTAMILITL